MAHFNKDLDKLQRVERLTNAQNQNCEASPNCEHKKMNVYLVQMETYWGEDSRLQKMGSRAVFLHKEATGSNRSPSW